MTPLERATKYLEENRIGERGKALSDKCERLYDKYKNYHPSYDDFYGPLSADVMSELQEVGFLLQFPRLAIEMVRPKESVGRNLY